MLLLLFVCTWTLGLAEADFQPDITLGPVVWKPINANPELTLNQGFNFSCLKFGMLGEHSKSL